MRYVLGIGGAPDRGRVFGGGYMAAPNSITTADLDSLKPMGLERNIQSATQAAAFAGLPRIAAHLSKIPNIDLRRCQVAEFTKLTTGSRQPAAHGVSIMTSGTQ